MGNLMGGWVDCACMGSLFVIKECVCVCVCGWFVFTSFSSLPLPSALGEGGKVWGTKKWVWDGSSIARANVSV